MGEIVNHGLPFHPHPGMLRAIICANGKLCRETADNPIGSGITADLVCEDLDKKRKPCGPHRVLLYHPAEYRYPDVQKEPVWSLRYEEGGSGFYFPARYIPDIPLAHQWVSLDWRYKQDRPPARYYSHEAAQIALDEHEDKCRPGSLSIVPVPELPKESA